MRHQHWLGLAVAALALAACGPTHTAAPPTATVVRPTSTPRPTPTPQSTAVVATAAYVAFVHSVCHAFASGDTNTLRSALPYYQYNTGLRYGNLGDGEGQNGDPSLFTTWLTGAQVRCVSYTPDLAGHGTLLTTGWNLNGGAALIDIDAFSSVWKFNDFTFGTERALRSVMTGSIPPVSYRG